MRCDVLSYISFGGLAQLVRASASHAEGRRFESATLHHVRRSQVHSASANMAKAPFILTPSSSPKRISIDSFWYYGGSCRAHTGPPRQKKSSPFRFRQYGESSIYLDSFFLSKTNQHRFVLVLWGFVQSPHRSTTSEQSPLRSQAGNSQ